MIHTMEQTDNLETIYKKKILVLKNFSRESFLYSVLFFFTTTI